MRHTRNSPRQWLLMRRRKGGPRAFSEGAEYSFCEILVGNLSASILKASGDQERIYLSPPRFLRKLIIVGMFCTASPGSSILSASWQGVDRMIRCTSTTGY